MQKIALIRYDEIHLKGNNRGFFERMLLKNLRKSVDGLATVKKIQGRFLATFFQEHEDSITEKLQKVFGVHSLSVATAVETDFDKIYFAALNAIRPTTKTFRITVNRADKTLNKNSPSIAKECGAYILEHRPDLKVDLHTAEQDIKIDIREEGKTYIFDSVTSGVCGMPVGTAGRGVVLLSGGIDSPVAAFYLAKRGLKLDALHFHSFPYTSKRALDKAVTLKNILGDFIPEVRLFAINTAKIQEAINEHCPDSYHIILLRRFMMKIANIFAKEQGASAIVTGESLAQVASQTVESLTCTNAASDLPIFRPLIGFDKEEIIKVAKKIGTYETSILPHEDCCTIFLPKNPVTKPKLNMVEKFEAQLPIDELVTAALATVEIL